MAKSAAIVLVSAVAIDHHVAARGISTFCMSVSGRRAAMRNEAGEGEGCAPRPLDLGDPTCRRRSLLGYRVAAMAEQTDHGGLVAFPWIGLQHLARRMSVMEGVAMARNNTSSQKAMTQDNGRV